MPATTPRGITYPTGSDMIDDLKAVFASMASSIDAVFAGYLTSIDRATGADVTAGTSTTKLVTPKALADAGVVGGDTGWVDFSAQTTAGSGFAKKSDYIAEGRKLGNVVQVRVHRLEKTSTNPLPIPTTGNIGNRVLVGGVPAAFRPARITPLSTDATGRANGYVIYPDGNIYITAMVPTSTQSSTVNCPVGEQFSCGGTFLYA